MWDLGFNPAPILPLQLAHLYLFYVCFVFIVVDIYEYMYMYEVMLISRVTDYSVCHLLKHFFGYILLL